jgi:hypothetical protein
MRRYVYLLAALFVGLACSTTLLQDIPPTPTLWDMPTLGTTPTVEQTSAPTQTASSTSTVSDTATVTRTPTITLTTTPTQDDAILSYANHRDDAAWILRDIKADIDPTFGKYIEGKVSATDPEWQAEVELYFNQFDSGVEWFAENTPPPIFEQSHELTLSGVVACSRGFWRLYDGARLNDNEIYQDGVSDITTCNHDWDAGDYAFWDVVVGLGLEWPAMSDPTLAP